MLCIRLRGIKDLIYYYENTVFRVIDKKINPPSINHDVIGTTRRSLNVTGGTAKSWQSIANITAFHGKEGVPSYHVRIYHEQAFDLLSLYDRVRMSTRVHLHVIPLGV